MDLTILLVALIVGLLDFLNCHDAPIICSEQGKARILLVCRMCATS